MKKKKNVKKEVVDIAQYNGKMVMGSYWSKDCTDCEGKMKIVNQAKNEGK